MSSACSSHEDGSGLRGASAQSANGGRALRARRTRQRLGLLSVLALLAALSAWPAATANADEASTIIERCTHGQSLAGFSRHAYEKALHELPTDVSEYSDCEELIRKAALAATTGGGPGGGGSAYVAPPTPAEQEVLTRSAHGRSTPVVVDGTSEEPGVVPVSLASALNSLPAPLLALLAALVASALVLAGNSLRRRERLPSLPIHLPRRK